MMILHFLLKSFPFIAGCFSLASNFFRNSKVITAMQNINYKLGDYLTELREL